MVRRREKIAHVGIKAEAVPGTAETSFADADFPVLIYEPDFVPDQQNEERNPVSQFYGREEDVAGLRKGSIPFQTEMFAALNHVTTPPPWAPFALACGWAIKTSETLTLSAVSSAFVAGETVTDGSGTGIVTRGLSAAGPLRVYTTAGTFGSSGAITGSLGGAGTISAGPAVVGRVLHPVTDEDEQAVSTLRCHSDGHLDVIAGALGNMTITATVGQTVKLDFDFMGKALSPDTAAVPAGTRPPVKPPSFKVATLTVKLGAGATYSPKFETIVINQGNQIDLPPDANDPTGAGYDVAVIEDHDPSGSIDMLAPLVADHNVLGHHYAADTGPLDFVVGSTPGQMFLIHCPKVQYTNVSSGNRVGRKTYNTDLGIRRVVGDDEIFIHCI